MRSFALALLLLPTVAAAQDAPADPPPVYDEAWHNRQRLHSAIGYITPEQMELTAA